MRTVIVTGANRGIGLALVRRLLCQEDIFVVCRRRVVFVYYDNPQAERHPHMMFVFQVLASRSLEKGEDAVKSLVAESASFRSRLMAVSLACAGKMRCRRTCDSINVWYM